MGYRLFFILLFFVFFVEMTGAKPPKKKENEVVEVNRIMDSVELSHFSDSDIQKADRRRTRAVHSPDGSHRLSENVSRNSPTGSSDVFSKGFRSYIRR